MRSTSNLPLATILRRSAAPIPFLKVGASGQTTTDYSLGIYQFGGFYQVADFAGERGNTTVELGAGARFIQQDFQVKARNRHSRPASPGQADERY